ncbi:MAG: hypothetical protein PWP48_777 [Clostridiales bacterium]|jgi:thiamin-phosphate kinase|nr:hypothetical protein [Clostridiales bacterium]
MIGKVNDKFFRESILPYIGAVSDKTVIGPKMGVDAAVLKLKDTYMVIAEDPIFPSPTISPDDFGWITVHIGASDVAVMGVKPEGMTYSLLLPPETTEEYIAALVKSISKYAAELGIAIVGGHTGYYAAVNTPIIGGITVFGFGEKVVAPNGAKVGDAVIITKGVAIEAASLIACELNDKLHKNGIKSNLIERAKQRFYEISVVKEAEISVKIGGVNAMHDATEGGLARGLWEVAEASGVGLRIEKGKIPISEDVKTICDYIKLNPLEVISEGTLILTCNTGKVDELMSAYAKEGIDAAVIGTVVPEEMGRFWIDENGTLIELVPPETDEFWEAFFSIFDK